MLEPFGACLVDGNTFASIQWRSPKMNAEGHQETRRMLVMVVGSSTLACHTNNVKKAKTLGITVIRLDKNRSMIED